jgi:uncharacterized membrane protein YdjX (TVP38/TMEM64 family)
MLRWWSLAFAIAATVLVMFFIASGAGIALLNDPTPLLRGTRPAVALLGILLLVADVFLPVPSSLVMAANGALFGIAAGTALSLVGSVASALTGFAVGRAGNAWIRRLVTPAEHERAGAMLARWGAVAIALSRPVPILAETVAILAGASPLTWRKTALASAAGSIAPAAVYAWAGAHASDAASHALIFGGVMLMTGVLWLIGRAVRPAITPRPSDPSPDAT